MQIATDRCAAPELRHDESGATVLIARGLSSRRCHLVRRSSTRLLSSASIFAALVVLFAGIAPASAPAATLLKPDMRMVRLSVVRLDTSTIPNHRLLRYTAALVDTGAGAFEVRGSRPNTSTSQLSVKQRIYDDAGGFTDVSVSGTFIYWAGDGHNHWHVNELEEGTLQRLSDGHQVGTLDKHGFHLVDDYKFSPAVSGAPSSAKYTKCGGNSCNHSTLNMFMGVSVGWVDRYNYTTVGQYIDITGLPNGKYVLRDVVDPEHWFTEANAHNNWASATIRIGNKGVQKLSSAGGV